MPCENTTSGTWASPSGRYRRRGTARSRRLSVGSRSRVRKGWGTAAAGAAGPEAAVAGASAALARCKAELVERTGGGIGGTKWLAPLLPAKFPAPVHHRWPEYVETVRGREWTIPTAADQPR